MPIYAYRCASCGHAQDVLRKISDPALTTCPACQSDSFEKQVTAAGFQLKGSGWYVTDFRGGSGGSSKPATEAAAAAPAASSDAAPAATPAPAAASSSGSDA
jgi:putative FmdB family regulatory protein